MADVRDVVTDALRELGVLAAGEVASADEATHGLTALNRLVDQWAAERLNIYTVTRTTWAIAASTQDYTVGTGGTVNRARPVYVESVRFIDTSVTPTSEVPLDEFTDETWASLTQKTATGTTPTGYYYNPTMATATLSLWPVPTSSTLTGVLYAPTAVAEFASLSTAISLPPGYRRLIVKNLALELAPSYGRQVGAELKAHAMDSRDVVKRSNRRMVYSTFDDGVLQGWNWR